MGIHATQYDAHRLCAYINRMQGQVNSNGNRKDGIR